MPFYEYQCPKCGHHVEVLQKISDSPLKKCPSCGQNSLRKLMSAPVFRLKGSGWYETDFKSDKENKRNLAGADKEETKSEAKTDAKPDAAKADGAKTDGAKTEGAKADGAKADGAKTEAAKPAEKPSPSARKGGARTKAKSATRRMTKRRTRR